MTNIHMPDWVDRAEVEREVADPEEGPLWDEGRFDPEWIDGEPDGG